VLRFSACPLLVRLALPCCKKKIGLAQLLLTSRLPPACLPLASQVPPARVVYTAGVEKMRTPGWGPVHRQAEGLHPGNGLIAKVHGTATRIVLMHVKISEAD